MTSASDGPAGGGESEAVRISRGRGDVVALIGLAGLFVAVAVLEISVLGRRPLANDEATSYFIAHLDWAGFWESLVTSEANGSAFYLSLRGWLGMGRSEAVMRVLPMTFALATIPILFATARRMFGSFAAVVAAAVLSTNVMFIEHAQDLRSYSLSALLVTISSWFFLRGLHDPSSANRIGHVAASALALYAHFFSALVLLAQAGAALLYPDRRRSLRFLAPNLVAVAVLAWPLAAFVLAGDRGQVDWIPELSGEVVHDGLLDLSGMPSTVHMALLAVVLVSGVSLALARRPPDPPGPVDDADAFSAPSWRVGFALLWFALPIVVALAISLVKPLFVSRYLLVALPGFAILTAAAIASLPQRILIAAGTAGVVLAGAVEVTQWYSTEPESGYAGKAAYIRQHADPNDAIAFYAPTIIRPFGYYAGYYTEKTPASPSVIYPDRYWLGYSRTRFTPPIDRMASDANEYERVWLVTGAARDDPRVEERRAIVAELFRTCTTTTQPLVGVRLFAGCNS